MFAAQASARAARRATEHSRAEQLANYRERRERVRTAETTILDERTYSAEQRARAARTDDLRRRNPRGAPRSRRLPRAEARGAPSEVSPRARRRTSARRPTRAAGQRGRGARGHGGGGVRGEFDPRLLLGVTLDETTVTGAARGLPATRRAGRVGVRRGERRARRDVPAARVALIAARRESIDPAARRPGCAPRRGAEAARSRRREGLGGCAAGVAGGCPSRVHQARARATRRDAPYERGGGGGVGLGKTGWLGEGRGCILARRERTWTGRDDAAAACPRARARLAGRRLLRGGEHGRERRERRLRRRVREQRGRRGRRGGHDQVVVVARRGRAVVGRRVGARAPQLRARARRAAATGARRRAGVATRATARSSPRVAVALQVERERRAARVERDRHARVDADARVQRGRVVVVARAAPAAAAARRRATTRAPTRPPRRLRRPRRRARARESHAGSGAAPPNARYWRARCARRRAAAGRGGARTPPRYVPLSVKDDRGGVVVAPRPRRAGLGRARALGGAAAPGRRRALRAPAPRPPPPPPPRGAQSADAARGGRPRGARARGAARGAAAAPAAHDTPRRPAVDAAADDVARPNAGPAARSISPRP